MKSFLLIWLAIMLPVIAEPRAPSDDLPPMPANGIYDPDDWLSEKTVTEMTGSIADAREKGEALIYIVILSNVPGDEVEGHAMKLGRGWAGEQLWGMIFHVPGDETCPKFFGELKPRSDWTEEQLRDFQNSIERAIAEAVKRIEGQEDALLRVEGGTRVIAEEFGYLGLVRERIEFNNAKASGDRLTKEERLKNEEGKFSWMFLVVIPLVLFAVVALGFLLVRKTEEEGDDYQFPETTSRKRFQAPWSGGGNVLVKFSSQGSEDRPRSHE